MTNNNHLPEKFGIVRVLEDLSAYNHLGKPENLREGSHVDIIVSSLRADCKRLLNFREKEPLETTLPLRLAREIQEPEPDTPEWLSDIHTGALLTAALYPVMEQRRISKEWLMALASEQPWPMQIAALEHLEHPPEELLLHVIRQDTNDSDSMHRLRRAALNHNNAKESLFQTLWESPEQQDYLGDLAASAKAPEWMLLKIVEGNPEWKESHHLTAMKAMLSERDNLSENLLNAVVRNPHKAFLRLLLQNYKGELPLSVITTLQGMQNPEIQSLLSNRPEMKGYRKLLLLCRQKSESATIVLRRLQISKVDTLLQLLASGIKDLKLELQKRWWRFRRS